MSRAPGTGTTGRRARSLSKYGVQYVPVVERRRDVRPQRIARLPFKDIPRNRGAVDRRSRGGEIERDEREADSLLGLRSEIYDVVSCDGALLDQRDQRRRVRHREC